MKAPRILVHCGHTICTACLYLFFRDQRIRCPLCKKVIKRLRIVEVLPLNHHIYESLLLKPGVEKHPSNEKLRLPNSVIEEVDKEDKIDFPTCEKHNDRL